MASEVSAEDVAIALPSDEEAAVPDVDYAAEANAVYEGEADEEFIAKEDRHSRKKPKGASTRRDGVAVLSGAVCRTDVLEWAREFLSPAETLPRHACTVSRACLFNLRLSCLSPTHTFHHLVPSNGCRWRSTHLAVPVHPRSTHTPRSYRCGGYADGRFGC